MGGDEVACVGSAFHAEASHSVRESGVHRPRLGACVGVVILTGGWVSVSANAAPENTAASSPLAAIPALASGRRGGGPLLRLGLSGPVAERLRAGWTLAQRRLATCADCRQLFVELGAEPVSLLHGLFFYPADANASNRSCRSRASAFTEVGSHVTWVCDNFALLTERQAAMVILHEALHAAGLPEQPQVPDALTSAEINARVAALCAL